MAPQRYSYSAVPPLHLLENAAPKQIHNLCLYWYLLRHWKFPTPYVRELLYYRLVQRSTRPLLPRQLQDFCVYYLRLYSIGQHLARRCSVSKWRKEYFRCTLGELLLDLDALYFPGRYLTTCEQGVTLSHVRHRYHLGCNKQGGSGHLLFPGDTACDSQIQGYISHVHRSHRDDSRVGRVRTTRVVYQLPHSHLPAVNPHFLSS